MLARNMQRTAARSFATAAAASSASGVRVAAVEGGVGGRTGSLTVLVKAGSRYEPKEGVANALKNFAFKVGFRSFCYGFFSWCFVSSASVSCEGFVHGELTMFFFLSGE